MNPIQKGQQKREDEFELQFVFQQMVQKWPLYVVAFVLLALAGFVYIKLTLPVYKSSASVLIEDSKSGPGNVEDILSSDLFGSNLNIPTEVGVLRSRSVFEETIDRLGLHIEYWSTNHYIALPLYPKYPLRMELDTIVPEFRELPFRVKVLEGNRYELEVEYEGDRLPEFSFVKEFAFGDRVTTSYFSFTLFANLDTKISPGRTYEIKVRSANKLVAQMLENFTAEPLDKDANIVVLTYKDVVPARAVDILNTIGSVYIDRDVRDKAEVASLTLRFVEEQLNNTGTTLSDTEQRLQEFKEKNQTVDLSEQSRAMLVRVNELDVERMKNNIELTSTQQLYDYVVKNDDLTPLSVSSLGLPDPLLVELITSIQAMQLKRKTLVFGVKEDAPAVRILDQQIKETKSNLVDNIRSIQQRMQIAQNSIGSKLSQYEGQISNMPEMERELLVIKRNVEVNQNIYTYLLQKKAETSIAKATVVSDNKILDQASIGDEAVEPNTKIIAVVILFLALFIPTGFILARALLRTTVLNKDDIASLTTVPVIGVVGHSDESESNLVVHKRPKSALAEGFRSVRTNLKFFHTGQKCTTILITSSVGGEGKSFVTLNLATIMALQQQKVVVVGLDLRKPKLFQDFGWSNDIGASTYLAGSATLEQVMRHSTIPNLDLIISGPIPPNPAELLSKPALREMFSRLKEMYDIVIIDTPPIGVVSDAFLVMPVSDVNLYLVRQGYSKLEYLRSLDDLYKEGKIPNVSILLNDSDFAQTYGYGYGHHYGYVSGNSGYYDMGEDVRPRSFFDRFLRRTKKRS